MPNYKEVDRLREMAEAYLQDMIKMDLRLIESNGISIEAGVKNIGLDAITFIWQENIMKDRKIRLSFFDHMDEYPDGFFVETLRYVADQWVAMGRTTRKKAYSDFGLIE